MQPNDSDAIHCKLISQIQLSKFDEALQLIDSNSTANNNNNNEAKNSFSYEKAYCLYRQKKLQESLQVLRSIPAPQPPKVLELEAQVVWFTNTFLFYK